VRTDAPLFSIVPTMNPRKHAKTVRWSSLQSALPPRLHPKIGRQSTDGSLWPTLANAGD
jgi:hypothetical protein